MKRFRFIFLSLLIVTLATELSAGRTWRVSFKRQAVGTGMSTKGGAFNVGVNRAIPASLDAETIDTPTIRCGRCKATLPKRTMHWAHAQLKNPSIQCPRCGFRTHLKKESARRQIPKKVQKGKKPSPSRPIKKPTKPATDKRTLR